MKKTYIKMYSSANFAEDNVVLNIPDIKQGDTEGTKFNSENLIPDFTRDDLKLVKQIKSTMIMQKTGKTFADVCGMEMAKRGLSLAVLLPEKQPQLFTNIKPYKGFLLFGLPGTGKTLIAKAIAGESSSTKMFSVSVEDILSTDNRGESESLLRNLFLVARMERPSIILIDHLDCMQLKNSNKNDDLDIRSIRSTLIEQMDSVALGVFVIGTTNQPHKLKNDRQILSCFDKLIYISLPNKTDRLSMLQQRFSIEQFTDKEFDMLATKMRGLSGADIDEIYKNAYYNASSRQLGTSTSKSLIKIEDVWECMKKPRRSGDDFDKFAKDVGAYNGNDVLEPLPMVEVSLAEKFLDFLAELLIY